MIRRLAMVVVLAGCATTEHAHNPSFDPPIVHEQELARTSDEIRRRDAELAHLDLGPTGADCARVMQLRDNICALAARICQIAAMQPPGSMAAANVGAQCDDGQSRCNRATERSQARGCPRK